MVSPSYSPHIGGVEKHVQAIAACAVADGHRVTIYTKSQDTHLKKTDHIDGVIVHRILFDTTNKYLERIFLWTWMLRHIPTFITADIIHVHDVFFWIWPIRLLLFWKKICITFHGFEAGSLPTKKAIAARKRALRWCTGSMGVGRWIKKWYDTPCDVYTYGGASCVPTQSTTQPKKPRAIFVGRREKDTGIFAYETACAKVGMPLDAYGAGQKDGLAKNTCALYGSYSYACVSSYLAIVEAMQVGVLVVAYASDALKYDYLQSHPRASSMVILKSPKELETFMREFEPKKYTQRIHAAQTWARQQTWERVYQKYQTLWNIEK